MHTPICSTGCLTSVHAPESTYDPGLNPSTGTPPTWPAVVGSGGFSLVGDDPGRKKSKPPTGRPAAGADPPSLTERAAVGVNLKSGIMFRHETWSTDRQRILAVLDGPEFSSERFFRFANCGAQSIVFVDPANPDRYKVGCNRCHDRFCLPCSQDRARLIGANLRDQMPDGPIRFVTLTLKHSDAPLAEQLDRLYESFARLRQRAFWKRSVSGGAAFTEVKISRTDGRWHPHLHVMCQGKYLPQNLLADAWFEVTGDSSIVDVRMAKSAEAVTRYLASYVTKGWSNAIYHHPEKLREIMLAMKGRKLVRTFGTWSKLRLLEPPPDGDWQPVATLHELIERARAGEAEARRILTVLHADYWVPPLEPCEVRDG